MAEQFPEGHLVQCKYGRRILVEILLVGSSHNARAFATCWKCLDQESRQRSAARYLSPEEVEGLQEE